MAQGQQELVFAPLGGVGEIGMNLSIYGLGDGRTRSWLAVDLGVSFATEEQLPGIDLILPDISYLVQERKNIVGLVLTHAHEDHFGALLNLWPRLKIPVYATPFTAALLAAKRTGEPGALTHRCRRRPRRRARGRGCGPRHGTHRANRARDRLSRWRAGISPGRRLWLSAAGQSRGAVYRQSGRGARGARSHRRGSASGSHAVARRHSDFFRPYHSRQRKGGRPHHQWIDRSGYHGDHRPHASGARLGSSAPRRA